MYVLTRQSNEWLCAHMCSLQPSTSTQMNSMKVFVSDESVGLSWTPESINSVAVATIGVTAQTTSYGVIDLASGPITALSKTRITVLPIAKLPSAAMQVRLDELLIHSKVNVAGMDVCIATDNGRTVVSSMPIWEALYNFRSSVLLVVCLVVGMVWYSALSRCWKSLRRSVTGLCIVCGYPLPDRSGMCPECGTSLWNRKAG